MLLSANDKTSALIGGIAVIRVGSGKYERRRADIVFRDGEILEVLSDFPPEGNAESQIKAKYGESTKIVRLTKEHLILPGLLDLHNHHEYNMLPLWDRPQKCQNVPWDNRHQWRHPNCIEYQQDIKNFYNYIKANWTKSPKRLANLFLFGIAGYFRWYYRAARTG